MAVDEARRRRLHEALVGAIGEEAAGTMFAMLPDSEVATRADVAELRGEMERRFGQMEGRFAEIQEQFGRVDDRFGEIQERFGEVLGRFGEVDGRFGEVDGRFGEVQERFGQLDGRIDAIEARIEAKGDEILAAIRGEMLQAIGLQTRWMFVAWLTTVVAVVGVTLAFLQAG